MVEVAANPAYAGVIGRLAPIQKLDGDFFGALGAAFRLENDVVAATRFLTRPQFEPEAGFDIGTALRSSPYGYNYTEELSRALSQAEFDSISQRIQQEEADKQLLARTSGGWAMQMGAGLLSPTSAIPFMGPAKGLKGAAQATALAFAGASAQEVVLYAAQETRTQQEVAVNIAAGTVLGGLLGTAATYLRKGDFDRIASDMAATQSERAVSPIAAAHAAEDVAPNQPIPALRDPVEVDLTIPTRDGAVDLSLTRNLDEVAPRLILSADGPAVVARTAKVEADFIAAIKRGETTTAAATRTEGDVTLTIGAEGQPEVYIRTKELESLRAGQQAASAAAKQGEKADKLADGELTGSGLDLSEAPVTLRINDKGEAIITGNADAVARARAGGAEAIPVKVEYMNGAHGVKGAWHPTELIKRLAQKTDDLRAIDELANAKEIKKAMDAPDFKLPEAQSAGAARVDAKTLRAIQNGSQLKAPNGLVRRFVFNQLAKLNPITRMIEQTNSPTLSYWAARISDAGLKTVDNMKGIAHAVGGTLEARLIGYNARIATAVQEYDKSYAAYVMAGLKEGEVNKVQIWLSQAQAGVTRATKGKLDILPEGKMNLDEFDALAFSLANTGKSVDDANIMNAVKLQRKFYDEFLSEIRRAEAEVKAEFGDLAPQLIPDDPNLGPGAEKFIHHMYDTQKIVADSGGFTKMLRDSAEGQYNSRFLSSQTKLGKRLAGLQGDKDFLLLPQAARLQVVKDLQAKRKLMKATGAAESAIGITTARLKRLKKINKDLGAKYRKLKEGTPEEYASLVEAEVKRVDKALLSERTKFNTRWRERGAVGNDLINGKADFRVRANDDATLVFNNITGAKDRVAGMDILGGERGATLARVLNIPFGQKAKYLISNPEQVMRSYGRQMASDIELYRMTGSVNGARMFEELADDFDTKRQLLETTDTDIVKPNVFNNDGSIKTPEVLRPMTPEIRAERLTALAKARKKASTDLKVTVARIRHQRGIPSDPDGFMYRVGRVAMGINVFRNMGMVTISSLADIGRPVMKAGIMDTFKYGYAPMLTGLKELNITRALARELGIALDPIMQNRARQAFDVLDNYASKQTFPERAVEFLANKTGFVAGFNRWTAEMKYISANVGMGVTGKYLRGVNTGQLSGKALDEAREYLAALGIDNTLSARIWKQFEGEGSTELKNGVRLPNLENWTDAEAIIAYKSAIGKWTDDTIVTPGLDKPNWVDADTGRKMVAQFRSFTFASTNRTVMAGLQDWNMQLITGVNTSLGMGALSYYLWAAATSDEAYQEMLNATPGQWADQMINRSGLLGVFAEPWSMLQRVPGLSDYTTFGGATVRNYRGSSFLAASLGPSYDLADKLLTVGMSAGYPTQSTAQTIRKVMAYQNVFWLNRLYKNMAQTSAEAIGLPERRDHSK